MLAALRLAAAILLAVAASPLHAQDAAGDSPPLDSVGVELMLPPGMPRPEAVPSSGPPRDSLRIHLYASVAGTRRISIMIFEFRTPGAWTASDRLRRTELWHAAMLGTYGGTMVDSLRTGENLASQEFRFTRRSREGPATTGRGRFYTPLSGPPLLVVLMYSEDTAEEADAIDGEEATALLDSVRVRAKPASR